MAVPSWPLALAAAWIVRSSLMARHIVNEPIGNMANTDSKPMPITKMATSTSISVMPLRRGIGQSLQSTRANPSYP